MLTEKQKVYSAKHHYINDIKVPPSLVSVALTLYRHLKTLVTHPENMKDM